MHRAILFLLLSLTLRSALGGSCNGRGTFEGDGLSRGVGAFSSGEGTWVGVGTFVGGDGASFEGSADCIFEATVTSVMGAQIIVHGHGVAYGQGRFEDEAEVFVGGGEMRGRDITFDGVGSFSGKGRLRQGGSARVEGRRFKCLGSGRMTGSGKFDGRGWMETTDGKFVGTGSFDGQGKFEGDGSCNGEDVEMTNSESVEDSNSVDAQATLVAPTDEPEADTQTQTSPSTVPEPEPSIDPQTDKPSEEPEHGPSSEEAEELDATILEGDLS